MVEQFERLVSIDYISFFCALFTIMAAFVAIKKGVEEFCKTFGFETPWMKSSREKREYMEKVNKQLELLMQREESIEAKHSTDVGQLEGVVGEVRESFAELQNQITALSNKIEQMELNKTIKKLRWDIINFASDLPRRENIPLEQYNIIFNDIKEYEKIIEDNGLTNGQVESSVHVIKKRYEHDLEAGVFDDKEE